MTNITTLIYDPSPGITPGDGSIIRTDQHDKILDLINGISAENYNLVQKVNKKTANYSMLVTDFIITADATGAGFTVTLPDATATTFVNKILAVKKIDSSTNTVTIQTVSSQTIDANGTSATLVQQNQIMILQSDGTNWITLASYLTTRASGSEKIFNPANTFYYSITTSAITANRNIQFPLITGDDVFAVLGLSQTFTATTTQINGLKLGGQLNANGQTILNTGTLTLPTASTTLAGLNVAQTWLQVQTFAATGIILAGAGAGLGTLTYANSGSSATLTFPSTSTTLAGLAVVQTFTAATTFQNSTLLIQNPAATFAYTIVASAIVANRNITLPLISSGDTFAVLGLAQTFSQAQTFPASGVIIAGAGAGLGTLTYANSASSVTLTLPATASTLAGLAVAETWTAVQTYTTGLMKLADIVDSNGNKSLVFTATGSAVNYVTLANSATNNAITYTLTGSDSNISAVLTPKGTGIWMGSCETIELDLTDETTLPTTGVKITTGIPYAMNIVAATAYVTTLGTGATKVEMDALIESARDSNSFSTIFTTRPQIAASTYTSNSTGGTPAVLTATPLAFTKDTRIQGKIQALDSNSLARGYKILLIGYRTS